MAAVAVARPFPTVLQPVDPHSRPRRIVSFSSDSIPSSGSNPHSGESWFQIPASQSSQSSTSSHHLLPKGARPASPQPTRVIEFDSPSHAQASLCDPSSLKRSGTFSSWKLEWRGIQKVVKWAVMGDKSQDAQRRRNKISRVNRNARHSDYTDSTLHREPISNRLDKNLPRDCSDLGVSPYICASPPPPLSPTTSATCIDALQERYYSHSELDHDHGTGFSASEVHFPLEGPPSISTELRRRRRSIQTSARHGSHVQELRYTNVRRAKSELGHGHPYGSSFDVRDTFSNVDQSTTSLESSYNWLRRSRVAHSDIGHLSYVEHMPVAGFSSAFSLSHGYDNTYAKPGADTRTFRNSRSIQSALVLPVSTTSTGEPLTPHRRPRKLRKSLRAMPPPDKRTSHLALSYSRSSTSPEALTASTSRTGSVRNALGSNPPFPAKGQPRQPRKLKKRPSPPLPPLPPTTNSGTHGGPPPVPPKTNSVLRDRNDVSRLTPVSCYYRSDASTESPPALTDTSTSTSPDDEFHSFPREPSVTSEHLSDEGKISPPVKRPSLLRTESNRRWTVGVADVPDDLIIEELERLHRMGLRAGDIHGIHTSTEANNAVSSGKEVRGGRHGGGEHEKTKFIEKPSAANAVYIQQVESEDETDWLYARRAILCCRDLVRTERSYQERLMELANGNICDSVPALLINYLPAVIAASRLLITKFNEDMSAAGLAAAFLSAQSTLERALVPWSGIVGNFFSGNDSSPSAAKRNRGSAVPGAEDAYAVFGAVKARRTSVHGRDKAYILRTSSTRGSTGMISASSSAHWLFRPAFAQDGRETPDKEGSFLSRRVSRQMGVGKDGRRLPSYRDLAILPTQRVTRYVLLYKDLLKHTPTSSPTRGLVEKAVETATILARKCDRAQDNSTFLYHH